MFQKKNNSTKTLMGISELTTTGVKTIKDEIVYFVIAPTNISVLSETSIAERVNALATVLKGMERLEILCLNSKENFDRNKEYLKQRRNSEQSPILQKLLLEDSQNLDRLQTTMSTAREFLVTIRLANDSKETNIPSYLARIAKSMTDQGFNVKIANEQDVKRFLSVYFAQNIATDHYPDFDGEQWLSINNMCV